MVAGMRRCVKSFTGGGSGGSPAREATAVAFRRVTGRPFGWANSSTRPETETAWPGASERAPEKGTKSPSDVAGSSSGRADSSQKPGSRAVLSIAVTTPGTPSDPASRERRAMACALDPGHGHRGRSSIAKSEEGRRLLGGIEVVVADEDERAAPVRQRRAEGHALEVLERDSRVGQVEQKRLLRRGTKDAPADRVESDVGSPASETA